MLGIDINLGDISVKIMQDGINAWEENVHSLQQFAVCNHIFNCGQSLLTYFLSEKKNSFSQTRATPLPSGSMHAAVKKIFVSMTVGVSVSTILNIFMNFLMAASH